MKLAVFDLDHTLMPMDTSGSWVIWMTAASGLRLEPVLSAVRKFDADYDAGRLDIDEFMATQIAVARQVSPGASGAACGKPSRSTGSRPTCRRPPSTSLKATAPPGDVTAVCTATYSFASAPSARLFGVEHLLACRAETDERGEFTGRLAGRNSFGPSKIAYVKDFLATDTCRGLTAADVVFYSDSMVDMPLFNFVDAAGGTCVAVNASPELAAEADPPRLEENRDLYRGDARAGYDSRHGRTVISGGFPSCLIVSVVW